MSKANGAKKSKSKPAAKAAAPTLVPQAHGGALLTGGVPGNKGFPGPGRPRSELRDIFRQDLETARAKMVGILERESEPCEECGGVQTAMDVDIVRIFDKLAKYSIGERKEVVAVDTELMTQLGEVVGRHVTDEIALEAIKGEWLGILASRLGS